jgi:aspartyl-tRNA(Asn)/glutamyl-tRNA(Gln) amidotransferase subunit A
VGLKPTYGRVSRFGLIAFASSLDQVGPIARSVRDAALALSVIAGPDEKDMTCSPIPPVGLVLARDRDLKGLRVGVPVEFFGPGLDPEIDEAVRRCHAALSSRGATIVDVSLPSTEHAIATYYIVATSEASSNLARYDGVRYGFRDRTAGGLGAMYDRTREAGFGAEVKRRIMLGTYSLASGYYDAFYLKAMKARALIRQDFERAFGTVDLLVGPTTPTPAFRLGEKLDDPLSMYLMDIYTATANLAGLPGLSLPCGFSASGLPIGCQLLAPWFEEARLLSAAALLEEDLAVAAGAPSLVVDS